ncbi:MAG: putative transcriptional regulator [Candidatus Nitrosomirales archaeon]|jgi:predicted transcriptional regulator
MQFLETVMSSELDLELVNKTTNILSILSKKDALTIFLLVKNGLKAETNTPQKVGLTRKQYYTRLKQLVDSGLIDKSGDEYIHTTLGSFVHQKHVLELFEHTKNVKQMKMVDTLKRTKQFSEDDITNFLGKIAGKNLTASTTLSKCRLISTYEDMVSALVERINFAQSEVLLASRFTNELIINAMARKANAGVDVKIVADTDLVKQFINSARDKLQVVDEHSLERVNVAGNPWYAAGDMERRYTHIPFSFMTFDGKEAGLEFVDAHNPGKFNTCMLVEDETICKELRTRFNALWGIASGNLTELLQTLTNNKPRI